MNSRASFTIAGAGPVGALLAVVLGRRGYKVDLFESRPDSRKTSVYQGKSINIALSDRGWRAMESIGIEAEIREDAIAMKRRVIHDEQGNLSYQPYGRDGEAIWSVSRGGINERLLTLAEAEANVQLFFEHKLVGLDFATARAEFQQSNGSRVDIESDFLFGADGAYSKVRRLAHDTPRFSYSQSYMPQCYIELNIPANEDGTHQLEKNALHIWPRKQFMLIALPNPDGSFTCTLFLNFEGTPSFEALQDRADVEQFFNSYFPDAMPYLQNPVDEFMQKTAAPLFLVHIYPWTINNKIGLIGDAAHAIVPFYGQGMNCGFEDCRELNDLIESCDHDWGRIFPAYEQARKPNGDAIAELSKRNFVEMSDLSGDKNFLLRKKIEGRFQEMYPDLWTPLYSMVTFSPETPYSVALETGDRQKRIMDKIMQLKNIESEWEQPQVYELLHKLVQEPSGVAR
ncbi:MAG: FAD-dependent monooxygenase [Gammaproteobacteria bacterium]|nr:FAD-dependent monooxygenase [Gammaproteobacteria bacterium]